MDTAASMIIGFMGGDIKLIRPPTTVDLQRQAVQSPTANHPHVRSQQDSPSARGIEENTDRSNGTLITWNGDNDPENPKNWSSRRKWKAIFAISSFVFLSPLSSTIVAPALPAIGREFHIDQPAIEQMVLSIFLLGFALGPLVASPLSEIYGRVRVVQVWNFVYILFNGACGAAQSKEAILVLRLLAGLSGSATLGIGGGTLSDLFRSENRGKAVAIYSWSPILAPLVGAVLGGFISEYTTWRWTFFASSLLSVVVQLSGFVFLEETYPPLILRRKRDMLRAQTGNTDLHTELLASQPIIQVLALYNAFLYGNIYILYADFVDLWTDVYGESLQIAGLNYLAIAIGSAFAAECSTLINDRIYRVLSKRNGGNGLPEFRVPIMIPATLFLAAGMFWYGWTADRHLYWILPDIGAAIFVAGALTCTISINAYVIDTYGRYAASGLAAVSTIRCLAGYTFPIFAPYLYSRLGYGWACSILGFISLGIGLPAAILLRKYGKLLREKSPYASKVQ